MSIKDCNSAIKRGFQGGRILGTQGIPYSIWSILDNIWLDNVTIPCCYTDFITCGGCRTKQQLQYLHFLISTQVAPHGVCRDLCEQICALPYNNLQVDLPSCLGTPALRMTALNMAGWAGPFTSSASSSPSGWNSSAQVTVCVGFDPGPPDPDTKIFTTLIKRRFSYTLEFYRQGPPKNKITRTLQFDIKKKSRNFYLFN